MILKLRENIYIGDENSIKEIHKYQITSVLDVADDMKLAVPSKYRYLKIGLSVENPTPSYIKDLACHAAKYQLQFGEGLLIVSKTGLKRAAFVACRVICELESKGIYEILQEIKKEIPDFKMGEAYI